MEYLVHVSITVEVDAGSEDEAVEIAADEPRGYKPKDFSFNVATPSKED